MPRRSNSGSGSGDSRNGNAGGGRSKRWRSRSRSRGRLGSNGGGGGGGGDQSHDGTNNDSSVGYASTATGGASHTVTCADNSSNNNNNGGNGGSGDFCYTSPSPVRKSGLTGNISSLFRTAFNRGSSGGSGSGSANDQQHRQQQTNALDQESQGYTPPLGSVMSPERNVAYNAAAYKRNNSGTQWLDSTNNNNIDTSKQKRKGSRFGFGGGSNNDNNKINNNLSVNSESTGRAPSISRSHSRLFYSNADDDSDSDNSFDERSRSSHQSGSRATTPNTFATGDYTQSNETNSYKYDDETATSYITDGTGTLSKSQSSRGQNRKSSSSKTNKKGQRRRHPNGEEYDDDDDDDSVPSTTILRYRGFSTSIQSLFLDEALVCASMGCFGLILSNRTEFLLQLRNDRRGVQWGRSSSRRTLPSRIVAYALLLTLLLIGITFVVWGFGSNSDNKNSYAFNNGSYNKGGSSSSGSSSSSSYNDDMANQNDDGGGNNNDDNNENDDNANNNNNDDGGNADDGGNNNYYYNNDDGGNNQAVDDDDANAAANDDGNYNNNNDDEGNNDDYDGNDDANGGRQLDRQATRRRRQSSTRIDDAKENTSTSSAFPQQRQQHRMNGIFKIRNMKDAIWEPAIDFLSDEWYRPYEEKHSARRMQYQKQHKYSHRTRMRELENTDDKYADNGDASSLSSGSTRDLASDLRMSLIIAFLVVLGILGRRRRMRTRYYLVRARAQEDHLFYASSGTGIKRVGFQDSREDQYEGACSHTLCGCYPIDPPREGDEIEDEVQVNDEGVSQRKKKPHNEDCISRGFNCLMGLCCGFICKCWFQCLSICSLAQEAREIRLLVPTRFQRVDYITHQPFHEYQKEVSDLRRGWMGKTRKKSGIMPHFNALSRLSRYILILSLSLTIVIAATLFFNPRASFSWPDVIILSATFLQSFLVIWVVHWIFHKSDLSLDAVIKFFAAGFVIAVPSAFFFEGVLVNFTLSSAYMVYGLGDFMGGEGFAEWITQHYRLLWIVVEIFNAYVVAAVTEELCKYYTFRCMEHPDLLFLTGLVSTTQDERAMEGGVVKYPFSSHQVQRTNMKNPYDDDASAYSRSSRNSHRSKGKNADLDSEEEFDEDEQDVRTYRQKAAAVTTSMICVAVGLACAENFLYVFLLGGTGDMEDGASAMDGYLQEWIVLFFRSVFPVHALAAAMQSVNMIRKFVETEDVNGHRIGVGRIILPAVIMHGSFDAVLLGINFFIETSWDDYMNENDGEVAEGDSSPYNPVLVNIIAWLSIVLVMLVGFLWYYNENRSQRLRLIELEEREKANQAGSSGYKSPKAPHVSDVELV